MRSVYILFRRTIGPSNITVAVIKVLFSFIKYFHNYAQCLFDTDFSGPPVARQNSEIYTLRMI